MSHNYSYSRPLPAKDLRASSFDSPDHLRPGDHSHNVNRSSQEPPSHSTIPSYPSSSSRASAATESPYSSSLSRSDPYSSSLSRSDPYSSSRSRSDQTLTLLSSCGLEPKDLSLLAEMPEDVITVENLPRLLQEIKKNRSTQQPPHPAMISYPPAKSRPPPATLPPGRLWEQGDWSRSQPLDYPLDPHPSLPPSQLPPTEQAEPWKLDWHGNPMQYTCSRVEPVRVVDYHYGKETPRSYETPRSTYSTAQGGSNNSRKPPNLSQPEVDYRYSSATTTDYRQRPDQDVPVVTKMATSGNTPTKKAALDFHGEIPQTFPYSCSLCDITVLSEKYWFAHANGTQHADGQLTLLKMYPEWDCRMQTARNGDDHTERPRVEEKTGGPSHKSINCLDKPTSSSSRKSIDSKTNVTKGKVVCARFTAHCLSEDGLKDLIKPFGEVVKIIMFPTLAFVEMGSTEQANGIVTYYLSSPVMVKGGQVTFFVSSTFNFLQSSRVLSFSPVPPGKESAAWKRALLAVAKGFGPVEHSLFLPTQAFVEMKNALDAQNLVGHHASKYLKIDGMHIKVAFSSEYNTLRTMSERKSSDRKSSDRSRKSSDRCKRKRTPSPKRWSLSPRRDSPTSSKRRKRRRKRMRRRMRSRERKSNCHKDGVKSNDGGKSRPRSPRKQSSSRSSRSPRSHTKERVSSEKTPGSCKTDPKKDKVSPTSTSTRSQPPTKDKTPSQSSNVMEKSEEAVDKTDQSKQETETQDSQENGAMEGVEVIGEDGDMEGVAVYGEENSDMGEEGEEDEGEEEEEEGEEEEEEEEGEEEEEVGEGEEEDEEGGEVGEEEEEGVEDEEVGEEEGEEEEGGELEEGEEEEVGAVGEEEGGEVEEGEEVGEEEVGAVGEEEGGGVEEEEGEEVGEEEGGEEEVGAVGEEEGGEVGEEEEGGEEEEVGEEAVGETWGEKQQESAEDLIQELSATLSEQGKELSATGSEQFFKTKEKDEKTKEKDEKTKEKDEKTKEKDEKTKEKDEKTKEKDGKTKEKDEKKDEKTKEKTKEKDEKTKEKTKEKDEKTKEKTARQVHSEQCSKQSSEPAKHCNKEDRGASPVNTDKSSNCEVQNDAPVPAAEEEKRACSTEDNVETKMEDNVETGPDSTKTGMESSFQPNNPVGREFIKPVMGYFCNLCKVVYLNEDEAKTQHCSSLCHYLKFMEYSSKDTASS